jgi:hypothetical protein
MEQYSPFLFDAEDIEFLQALRNYLAEPKTRTFEELRQYDIQHFPDLLTARFRQYIYARRDYIYIQLNRRFGRGNDTNRLVITKTATRNGYCAFLPYLDLYPILSDNMTFNDKEGRRNYYLQGNVYISLEKSKRTEKS